MTERFSAQARHWSSCTADRRTVRGVPRGPAESRISACTAMVQWVFVTALTLVSALALALVYGLGGFFALRGQLDPAQLVSLALLLTRLYAPLTALASARVEVMRHWSASSESSRCSISNRSSRRRTSHYRCPARSRWSSTPYGSRTRPQTRCRSPRSRKWQARPTRRRGSPARISFRAEPGQLQLALVGSSGTGKSTMAQLAAAV